MSRYLAIVLLATVMFFWARRLQSLLSLRGFWGFSSDTSCFITSFIAVEEISPPNGLVT